MTEDERKRVLEVDAPTALDYDHEISHWFTPEQIRTLYRTNPAWAARERQVYGGLEYLD